jgi:hypothetical protein
MRYGTLQAAGHLKFPPDASEFISYRAAAGGLSWWKSLLSVNALLSWLKVFKYLYHLHFLQDMLRLVYAVAEDAAVLLAGGLSISFGFAIAFVLTYGDTVAGHSTLGSSMLSLYHLMLGNGGGTLELLNATASHQGLGVFFVVSFTFLMTLLLLNVFVAILVRAILQVEP